MGLIYVYFTNMHDNCAIMCMLICFCSLYVISYEIEFLTLQLNLMFATFKSYSTVAEKGLCDVCGYSMLPGIISCCGFLYQYIVHEHVLKYQSMPWYFYC